jgi:hypothetical protein
MFTLEIDSEIALVARLYTGFPTDSESRAAADPTAAHRSGESSHIHRDPNFDAGSVITPNIKRL